MSKPNEPPSPEAVLAAILCCIHAQGRREVSEQWKDPLPPREPTPNEIQAHLRRPDSPEMRAMESYAAKIAENLSADLVRRQAPTDAFHGFVGSVKRETDRFEDAIGSIVGLPPRGRR